MGLIPREIEIVIDELVLHGFHALGSRSVADALESQIAAELRSGADLSLQSKEYVDAGPIELPLRPSPLVMGRAIARAVGKELR